MVTWVRKFHQNKHRQISLGGEQSFEQGKQNLLASTFVYQQRYTKKAPG